MKADSGWRKTQNHAFKHLLSTTKTPWPIHSQKSETCDSPPSMAYTVYMYLGQSHLKIPSLGFYDAVSLRLVFRFGLHQAIKFQNVSVILVADFIWISRMLEKGQVILKKRKKKNCHPYIDNIQEGLGKSLSESSVNGLHYDILILSLPCDYFFSHVFFCSVNITATQKLWCSIFSCFSGISLLSHSLSSHQFSPLSGWLKFLLHEALYHARIYTQASIMHYFYLFTYYISPTNGNHLVGVNSKWDNLSIHRMTVT